MFKDGESYVILGNLYLSEDRVDEEVDAIKKGLKKKSRICLRNNFRPNFELQEFDE